MNPDDIVHLLPSEELFQKAKADFEIQKQELVDLLSSVNIQQVGSSAVPGMIGKFDVDIQIRVTQEQFQEVIQKMREHYTIKRSEIWTDYFASFSNNKEYLIDLMVTIIDSPYDDYYKVRDVLMADPELVQEYNDIKMKYESKTYAEYKEAKLNFLKKIIKR